MQHNSDIVRPEKKSKLLRAISKLSFRKHSNGHKRASLDKTQDSIRPSPCVITNNNQQDDDDESIGNKTRNTSRSRGESITLQAPKQVKNKCEENGKQDNDTQDNVLGIRECDDWHWIPNLIVLDYDVAKETETNIETKSNDDDDNSIWV